MKLPNLEGILLQEQLRKLDDPSSFLEHFSPGGLSIPRAERASQLLSVIWALTRNQSIYVGDKILEHEFAKMSEGCDRFRSSANLGLFWFRSSGSTGYPKFLLHSGDLLVLSASAIIERIEFDQNSRFIHVLPSHYMSGVLNALIVPWVLGAEIYVAPTFNFSTARTLGSLVSKTKNNVMWVSPNVLRALTVGASSDALSQLNILLNATGPISERHLLELNLKAPSTRLLNTYGSTELLFHTVTDGRGPWQGVGKPLAGVAIVLDHQERVCITSKTAQLLRVQEGEFQEIDPLIPMTTNDLGKWLQNGSLDILGRFDDFVSLGGIQVNLAELEVEFSSVSGVEDCAIKLDGTDSWADLTLILETGARYNWGEVRAAVSELAIKISGSQLKIARGTIPRLTNGKPDKKALGRLKIN